MSSEADRSWLLQQIAEGQLNTEAIEDYIRNSRPDLVPTLQIWRQFQGESPEDLGYDRRHRDGDYDESEISRDQTVDLVDIAIKILETLENTYRELRKLRAVANHQLEINSQLAQALENIAEALNFTFDESLLDDEETFALPRTDQQMDRRRGGQKGRYQR